MNPVEEYLQELKDIRSYGAAVKETSYYGPLETLFSELGKPLKPRVRCIIHPQNQGAGIPDGGLFTSDQVQRDPETALLRGLLPSRGVIEAKGTSENVAQVSQTAQVAKYAAQYGQVLVTNYRDFLLVGRDAGGAAIPLEGLSLAQNEAAFWQSSPQSLAKAQGERLAEFLRRVMLRPAPLTEPKDVAWFLASYAREAKARIEHANVPALTAVRNALEEALGLQFEGERGDHFFRSTLVQTLFYGVFSAWVLWHKENPQRPEDFDWRLTPWQLHVPVIRALFEQVSTPSKLGALDLVDVLDWTGATLNRVDRKDFFARFDAGHAVQYFYEPFLQAYDPELRKDLGVWYTPPEIVQYMVARVDTVLREELEIPDGLADPRVYVLDPCCGTGAYLVEVLRRIEQTLSGKGGSALTGHEVKRAAMDRVFGFEILPAPFVVSHLQLGLLMQTLGAPFSDELGERAGVYLTNSLTGWEPPKDPKHHLVFPELEQERDAADRVKQERPILVVLGNPPYNAFAGVSPAEELGLVEPYKTGLISDWNIKRFNLDDLYVRFFRLAERRIAEQTGKGVIAFITNYSYLSDPSFVTMRCRFLSEFDSLWFDSLNGDSRETGKTTPDGSPDPSVFSTQNNKPGIRVGTVISVMVRRCQRLGSPAVRFRNFWGVAKRVDLLLSLEHKDFDSQYQFVAPERSNRFALRPTSQNSEYLSWPGVDSIADFRPTLGILENRNDALMSIDKEPLEIRMRAYFDKALSWADFSKFESGLSRDAARFPAMSARKKALAAERFDDERLRRLFVRPMDYRWCYYTAVRPVWNEPRPVYARQSWSGNSALVVRRQAVTRDDGVPFSWTTTLGAQHALQTDAYYIPLLLNNGLTGADNTLGASEIEDDSVVANLSASARSYTKFIGLAETLDDRRIASSVWEHFLAIGCSPAYLSENNEGIRIDWPRIPLPAKPEALLRSAELGGELAALLDTEATVLGVTTGEIRPELRQIAVISRAGGGHLDPNAGDLAVTAGWGHAGKDGVTMPAKGRTVVREYTAAESETLGGGPNADPSAVNRRVEALGARTRDVCLNDRAYWSNVPERVWGYTIGGYQVIKKWLSYRERPLLGRDLTPDEANYVTEMARRIAAILLLEPELDANYLAVKGDTYPWKR